MESKRVLIVDDDTLLRGLCALALRPAGYALQEAESGEDALQCFAAARTDLIILAVQMDGIDGYEACRRIRLLPGGASVPIIMLTGLDDADSIERAYEAGATDFIAKPFQWPLLAQRVRYALRAAGTAEASRQLASSLARAQEMAQLGSWTMAPDGSVQCSEQLLTILGLAPALTRVSQEDLLAPIADSDRERIQVVRNELARQGKGYEEVYVVRRADGVLRTVYEQALMVSDCRGDPLRMEGITQDITARVQAERCIQELASLDVLTGLPDRNYFQKLLQLFCSNAQTLESSAGQVGAMALSSLAGVLEARLRSGESCSAAELAALHDAFARFVVAAGLARAA